MTSAVADFEVEADLDGDQGVRYLASAPARLAPITGTVVVHRLAWVDAAAWLALRPVLDAVHAVAAAEEHLVDLVDAGFVEGEGAWYVTADRGRSDLAENPSATEGKGPADLRPTLGAVGRAALAIHALHEAGIVHQGVRPDAIGPDGTLDLPAIDRTRLGDGVALEVTGTTRLDTVDPALVRGGHPSRETDLYALGATLHRVVSGSLLHPDLASDPPVIALQRAMFEPARLAPELDPDVAATVAACIAPDPAARPPSAQALGRHLLTLADRP